ncbi:MAG: T9SS type A sorting domain-containing protein, partial [candidate division Zixibacteria bacterium]|nr:T9SS type A sorting domain-containing protein [candidate division Zixibacteria bacterium]
NPFNATTTITYQLPEASSVNLAIYNLSGQKVAALEDGFRNAGEYSVTWDASNYSSGVYFYKLEVGGEVFTKRMTLLK